MNNYGESLKEMRESKGYSQNALSKAIGISQPKISYYEKEQHAPPIDFCITLAKFYGCTLDELVGLTEPSNGYEQNNTLPTKLTPNAIAFANDFGDMFNDKNYVDISKLYKAITPELRALTLGYIIGILQRHNINTTDIIGY